MGIFGFNHLLGTILKGKKGKGNAETDWMTPEKLALQCTPGDLIESVENPVSGQCVRRIQPTPLMLMLKLKIVRARIMLRKLVDVANTGDTPGHCQVRINNKARSASKKLLKAKHTEKAIVAAKKVADTYVEYGFLKTNNCEYYCCKLKGDDVDKVLQGYNRLRSGYCRRDYEKRTISQFRQLL